MIGPSIPATWRHIGQPRAAYARGKQGAFPSHCRAVVTRREGLKRHETSFVRAMSERRPWQGPPRQTSTPSSCGTCTPAATPRLPPRKVIVNAFDDVMGKEEAPVEARRATNGNDRPGGFAELVALVERYQRERPIDELEIACHGSGVMGRWGTPDEDDDAAQQARVAFEESDAPEAQGRRDFYGRGNDVRRAGSLILGRRGELVSARSLAANARERELATRLGRCIEPGGRIVFQACNLAFGQYPWGDFLEAFSRLAPHVTVSGAFGFTGAGTSGLQGPEGAPIAGRRIAADGTATNVLGEDPGHGFRMEDPYMPPEPPRVQAPAQPAAARPPTAATRPRR